MAGRKRLLRRSARRWLRTIKGKGRNLLVIGCARGELLRLLLRKGHKPIGIDPDPTPAEESLGRIEDKPAILRRPVEEAGLADESLDGAAAVDSLGCLPNPAQTLLEIHRVLRSGGTLLVTASNIRSYAFRLFGDAWEPFAPEQTLFHFSPENLTVLVEEAGFKIRTLRQVGDGRVWLAALRSMFAGRGWKRLARWTSLRNPACRFLAGATARLASLFGRGDRLVLIAEKR